MQFRLSKLLSFNAGYVDTASFLALHGLFSAHVTGNFVTLGAALVSESQTGAWAKLAALPMFCITVLWVKLLDQKFVRHQNSSYAFFLKLMFLLFSIRRMFLLLFTLSEIRYRHEFHCRYVIGSGYGDSKRDAPYPLDERITNNRDDGRYNTIDVKYC